MELARILKLLRRLRDATQVPAPDMSPEELIELGREISAHREQTLSELGRLNCSEWSNEPEVVSLLADIEQRTTMWQASVLAAVKSLRSSVKRVRQTSRWPRDASRLTTPALIVA